MKLFSFQVIKRETGEQLAQITVCAIDQGEAYEKADKLIENIYRIVALK